MKEKCVAHERVHLSQEEDHDKWQNEEYDARMKLYLHEFELTSAKIAESMEDLTDEEVRLWKIYLKYDIGDVPDAFTDLFDIGEYDDLGQVEIRVMYWRWNDQTLVDINAWPGDNESGAIFIDGVMVFTYHEDGMVCTASCSDALRDRDESFDHIRTQRCHKHCVHNVYEEENNHPVHKQCEHIRTVYERLMQS